MILLCKRTNILRNFTQKKKQLEKEQQLRDIVKAKGIGPKGSKSVSLEHIGKLDDCLSDDQVSLVTKATFMTALLLLEPTEIEASYIQLLKDNYKTTLPKSLHFFFEEPASKAEELIMKLVQHLELNEEECRWTVDFLLHGNEEYLKAALLEGERLKRETFQENYQFFNAFLDNVSPETIEVDNLLLIAESFDGVVRNSPFTLFTLPVLAALGMKVYVTGVDTVAPKHGVTFHQLLKAAGKSTERSVEDIKNEIENGLGWGYIDQKVFYPTFYALKQMRHEMVKRPFLATFEKLIPPIVNSKGNVNLITSYTHSHYRMEVVKLIDQFSLFDTFVHLKGLEATTMLKKSGVIERIKSKSGQVEVDEYALTHEVTSAPLDEVSLESTVALGEDALQGVRNYAYDMIINQATFIFSSFYQEDVKEVESKVKKVLSNQLAWHTWKKYSE